MKRQLQPLSVEIILLICILFLHSSALRAEARDGSSPSALTSEITAAELGVTFVAGSNSEIVVEKNGKRYVVDAATHAIREAADKAAVADPALVSSSV
ncbi:MAG: hypothetical protein J2P13_01585, partial [Acidobacteria bacterium]|nr:hypothetical protein [Acidobacteriota bacterium]